MPPSALLLSYIPHLSASLSLMPVQLWALVYHWYGLPGTPQPLLFGGQFHGVFNICYGLEELLPGIEVLSRPQFKIPVKGNEREYSKERHLTRRPPR